MMNPSPQSGAATSVLVSPSPFGLRWIGGVVLVVSRPCHKDGALFHGMIINGVLVRGI